MRNLILCVAALVCSKITLLAQVSYTADNTVLPYDGYFYYGTNGGYYYTWDDKSLADIAAGNPFKNVKGLESKTFRPPLPAWFVDYYSYNVRINEFQHYNTIGARDHTVILNSPADDEIDTTYYDRDLSPVASNECGIHSYMFRNMYTPIWDGGLNGTPYNDTNYCARYIYEVVSRYKTWTKFWEIVNEPDFDGTQQAWKPRGTAGNWWENIPYPCSLSNLRAPVFHYIRWLRIAYDVIKTLDPTAYVAPGGLGYASFVDILCRYTDNPVDGSVTPEYPLKGSAYFDVLSFHSYPQYALASWSNAINGWYFERHSDKAVQKFIDQKKEFDSVLKIYGYDGIQKPKKLYICTETNIPSKAFGTFIGSDQAQTNYIMKVMLQSQKNGVLQTYPFVLGDDKPLASATDGFQLMGLYESLTNQGPYNGGTGYNHKFKNSGIGYKTLANLLLYTRYDSARTAAMNIPATQEGAAFRDTLGGYIYALWTKTTQDMNESATGTYSFPAAMNVAPQMKKRLWNYSSTGSTALINSTNIALNGTPILLSESFEILPDDDKPGPAPVESEFAVNIYPNPASSAATLSFTLKSSARVRVAIYNTEGRLITTAIADRSFNGGSHVVPLPIQQLTSGVYYCRFTTEKSEAMKKFIIVR